MVCLRCLRGTRFLATTAIRNTRSGTSRITAVLSGTVGSKPGFGLCDIDGDDVCEGVTHEGEGSGDGEEDGIGDGEDEAEGDGAAEGDGDGVATAGGGSATKSAGSMSAG